jgi:chemotaxis signal transduction protein
MSTKSKFVLFPLGKKRFALPADAVSELARPDHLQEFPHCTPWLAGVLLRRGRIIPVLDVAQVVLGPDAPPRRFYLIANREFGDGREWTAVPVTGECELTAADVVPPTGRLPGYVTGLLSFSGEIIEVLDLAKVAAVESVA